jgi:hypothetical protein
MPQLWDETTGVDEVDDVINPFRRKRGGLMGALSGIGMDMPETGTAYEGDRQYAEEPRLSHRITDDAHTASNRSGGPASTSANAPYSDPGQGRLKDLMAQERQAETPAPKPGIGRRLLQSLGDTAPTLVASAMGSAGGAVGADQAMQQGVKRRHSQEDLQAKNKREDVVRLKDQIEQESRGMEQRTFQHGEDVMRQETAERGMNERARLAQEMETGRNDRLAKTIESREGMQQDKFGHDEAMEDQKQVGRMQLQMARQRAMESVARIRAAAAGTKIPPLVGKAVDTFQDSQSRMDVMSKAYQDALRDPGNQQAMLNLLANHLGMTMGLQKGARLNQSIIDEAKRSGYLDERIEAHFGTDGYMTGVVLTPRQMSQMVNLAQDRLMEDSRKIVEMEQYFGVKNNANNRSAVTPRIPGNTGSGAGGGAGGAGAASAAPPKTADEYLKKRKNNNNNNGTRPN